MNCLFYVDCQFSCNTGISLQWASHYVCWDVLHTHGWVVVCRVPLLQADLPGQILTPVEGPNEASYHEGMRICLHRSACNKCLEFVNTVNKEYLLAGCSLYLFLIFSGFPLLWFCLAFISYALCLCVCIWKETPTQGTERSCQDVYLP